MDKPLRELFNRPEYYTVPMPAELATSRLWQLVYGEFRAPQYMAVLRRRLELFNWNNFRLEEAAELYSLCSLWLLIPEPRQAEWPIVRELMSKFRARLLKTGDGIEAMRLGGQINPLDWIDDDAEWGRLVTNPYNAIGR